VRAAVGAAEAACSARVGAASGDDSETSDSVVAATAPATTASEDAGMPANAPPISPGAIDSRSATWRGSEAIPADKAAPRRSVWPADEGAHRHGSGWSPGSSSRMRSASTCGLPCS
jgi:hypothetical protein